MVTQAVEDLSKNADEMLQFIDERVLVDYDKFVDVATQYHDDADGVTTAASNTSDLVRALGGIEDEANANKDISELLSSEVSKFKNI